MLSQSAALHGLSPPPLFPEMRASRLLSAGACTGGAAADAAGVEGSGHACLTSGTEGCVWARTPLFYTICSFI